MNTLCTFAGTLAASSGANCLATAFLAIKADHGSGALECLVLAAACFLSSWFAFWHGQRLNELRADLRILKILARLKAMDQEVQL